MQQKVTASSIIPYKRQQLGHPHTLTISEVHETVHLKSKIVVLHKYLNNKQQTFCLLQFSPDVAIAQNFPHILRVYDMHRNRQGFQVCATLVKVTYPTWHIIHRTSKCTPKSIIKRVTETCELLSLLSTMFSSSRSFLANKQIKR